ncbi:hypothetical protein AWC38_SpisGene6641 [Stylophora pistillata]|uniref:Uncharacterized protein n=1 Tax=Stylophora pistillata TaxID=50429 RepID=A0A2B4SJ81_STYPI|nr:hypothetical protein AWC38_SpisGene6641 [Stylophora pistillata]
MPRLKVNVNGKKYTISGITRETCSKQILCALAKVDAELRSRQTTESRGDPLVNASGSCEEKSRSPKKVRETRKKFKKEEKCARGMKTENKQRERTKRFNGKVRITKLREESSNDGIQFSSGISEAVEKSSVNQQNCLPSLNKREGLREEVIESSLRAREDLDGTIKGRDTSSVDSKESNLEDRAQDTDHDTGIKHGEYIVAELVSSETDIEISDECTCVYIDSETEELQKEIEKMRSDLKLTESKLIEQKEIIEMLNVLLDNDDDEYCANCDVNDDVNKRIH